MSHSKSKRISLWSGPRSVSTALMYAFAQRKDTLVYDEPLYAHYLANSDAYKYHPGAEETLNSQDKNGQQIIDTILLADSDSPVLFFKNMANHLVKLDWGFLQHLTNIILIRDPRDMLLSYSKKIEEFTIEDTGYPQLQAICNFLIGQGTTPLIIDSKVLLENPEKSLCYLCEFAGIDFDPAMLSWPIGPKKYDGTWACHWYHNIHKSTTFLPHQPKKEPFPDSLKHLRKTCESYYDTLMQFSNP